MVVSEFVTELRTQVDHAGQALTQARRSADPDHVHQHSARLLDLLDRAAAHGVDTHDWVADDLVATARTAAGNGS